MNLRKDKGFAKIGEKLLLVLLIGIGMIMCMVLHTSNEQKEAQIRRLNEGWYYLDGEQKIEVKIPGEITWSDETLILYNDSLTESEAGLQLSIDAAKYDAVISCGDMVLYQYNDERFPRNDQMKSKLHCDGYFPTSYDGETVKIILFNTKDGIYHIPEIYIGTGNAILLNEIEASVFILVIAVIMLALSVFAIGTGIYLKKNRVYDVRFMNVASFLIVCSVWCITDAGVIQQYSENYALNSTISFFAFMVLAIPMLHFIKNTEYLKNHRFLEILNLLFYANAIVQGILKYLDVFEFVEMLWVTHVLLFTGCVSITFFILKEYRENKTEELKTILYAFLLLAASGVIALILYWSLKISYYSFIFEIGIIVYVVLLLKGVILSAATNMRAKTEIEVLQRLAREDRLTGLGNRRAFDDYMIKLQQEAASLENALLIFIDINCLKETNDHYGHSAGDELIIAIAKCLTNTFDKYGSCFRMSGDEFCVIVKNPSMKEEEMYQALEKEIQRYNRESRFWLSVAKGGSYLREEDGTIKTISNWKYQADCEMYEDKKRKRHE